MLRGHAGWHRYATRLCLWRTGMHMHDIDSHESALMSAVDVVTKLTPNAPRLRVLGAGRVVLLS